MDFIEPAKALEALRSSDFDNLSAYAEVIDNSIQAKGKKINIQISGREQRAKFLKIEQMAFGDDGIGMDVETLHSCLKLGWSSRFNDRSGIGRFGVGMILGAIHECRRIEVYSKQIGKNWNYTYIDLDEIGLGNQSTIPKPIQKEVPSECSRLVNEESGTLVIWTKYDKQRKAGATIITETENYLGRVYRKFIWDHGVEITINGRIIFAFDPLYVRTEKTKFPNDPVGIEFEPMYIEWPIPEDARRPGSNPTSKITIKMSELPIEFRKVSTKGGSLQATERQIPENEGLSILRNGREVFYGTYPRWTRVRMNDKNKNSWRFKEIDRWWGCQIEFNADLDQEFLVKNIKRGAEPDIDLKRTIKEKITATRDTVLEHVRKVWEQNEERSEEYDSSLDRNSHSKAEIIAMKANKFTPKNQKGNDITLNESSEKFFDNLSISEKQKAEYIALFRNQPFTIRDDHWKGNIFWDVEHGGGNTLLTYNNSHRFFKVYYDILNKIDNDNITYRKLTSLIDLLLISVAKSQSLVEGDEISIDYFNNQWGLMLEEYVKAWENEMIDE